MATTTPIDENKLNAFMGQFVQDLGAALSVATVMLGDQLGLYKAMSDGQPLTPEELARRTGTDARYVREWLSSQAASGYVSYNADSERFALEPEQALALAHDDSPAFIPGAFQLAAGLIKDEPRIAEAFRSGSGVGWTIILAEAFPRSEFVGFDYHPESIVHAREAAARAGVDERVTFEVSSAKEFPGSAYDLVAMFDCLHDMGDPVGAARHVHHALAGDGTWLIVEPFANDDLSENLNPVGRVFYSASTMVCTPASRDQEVGLALGAQAGEARLREVIQSGGFTRFRRATETPFNLVLEARP